jgi:O-antigen/teichoic acid export membrane protein
MCLTRAASPLRLSWDLQGLRKHAPGGLLALLDQGLISGSNFALGVLLARRAGPEPYGAYMLLFAAFLLIANVYQALVLEPTNVLAFSLFPGRNDRYLRTVLLMHGAFTLLFGAAGTLLLIVVPHLNVAAQLRATLAGVLVATPCVLLFWLARCFAYLEMEPSRAVSGSLVYCGALCLALLAAPLLGGLSPRLVFFCTAGAALAASAQMLYARMPWGSPGGSEPSLSEVWSRHWRFGRWGLGSVGLSWAQTNSISFISGSLLGLREVGGLNAMVALLLPMFQVLTSATRVALPRIARIFTLHGIRATQGPVLRVAAILLALSGGYALVISSLHTQIFRVLYGARFLTYAWMVPLISMHIVAWAAITACDVAFSSIQFPQASFRIKVLMAAMMIPANTFLTWRFGLLGAVIGVPAFSTATALMMAFQLRSVWREESFAEAAAK